MHLFKLPPWAWSTAGLLLVLRILGTALDLPSGYGGEAYLGITPEAAKDAMIGLWQGSDRLPYALAYLGIDLLLFVPAYAVTSAIVSARLMRLMPHWWAVPVLGVAVTAALVVVDVAETGLGLAKLGYPAFAAVAGLAPLLVLGALALRAKVGYAWALWAGIAMLAAAAVLLLHTDAVCAPGAARRAWSIGCTAHFLKMPLIVAMVLLPLLVIVAWLCGRERIVLRAAIVEIGLRSRYVLLMLVLSSALLLGLDQCRDVLVGLLTTLRTPEGDSSRSGVLAALAVSLAALWTFSHSCWLWTRVACRVPGASSNPWAGVEPTVEQFARRWTRVLGLVPLLAFAQLASLALHDLMAAGETGAAFGLFWTAMAGLVLGAGFLVQREYRARKTPERYFDDPELRGVPLRLNASPWRTPRYTFWFGVPNAPVWLPLASLVAMVLCRLPASLGWEWPPLVFAGLLFAFSAWVGVLSWLGLVEQRQAIPWVLLLVLLVGLFGIAGWTENHQVWTLEQSLEAPPLGAMWLGTAWIAMGLVALGWWCTCKAQDHSVMSNGLVVVAVLAFLTAGLWALGGWGRSAVAPGLAPTPALRLEPALQAWLGRLQTAYPLADGPRVPVYFVAAEGGGLRAGFWTAQVLHQLQQRSLVADAAPQRSFLARTFAISSVSGSSLGVAALVGCSRAGGDLGTCIDRLGATDLVSPLLGSWMFEDALARLLPTAWCRSPACGLLSRGIWFETTLKTHVEPVAQPLQAAASGVPHMLMNSTWVETGERAIASDLAIDSADFPTARSTVGLMQRNLALATAAHNSARFPFVNAIGAVHSAACPGRAASSPEACGHVADGGYFDNGGSHTTLDVVRQLRAMLADGVADADGLRAWARARLEPRVILLHNGAHEPCQVPSPFRQPSEAEVRCTDRHAQQPRGEYRPQEPRLQGPLNLYADVLGVPVTAFNTTGLGANRFRADSLLIGEIDALRTLIKASGPAGTWAIDERRYCVERFTLYPLGWYLSPPARNGMKRQARRAAEDYVEQKAGAVVCAD